MSKTHIRSKQVPVTVKPKSAQTPVAAAASEEPTIPVSTATSVSDLTAELDTELTDLVGPLDGGTPASELTAEERVQGPEADDEEEESEEEADLSLLEEPVNAVKAIDEDEEFGAVLEVFKEDCLRCKHLVPFAKKKFTDCHYKKGNTKCPAASTQVIVRIPLEQIVPRWLNYEANNDFAGVARMSAKLAEKPEHYQQRVAQALQESRQARLNRS